MVTTLRRRKAFRGLWPPEPIASAEDLSELSKIVYGHLLKRKEDTPEERTVVLNPFMPFLHVGICGGNEVVEATKALIEYLGPADKFIQNWEIFDVMEKKVLVAGKSLSYEEYALANMLAHPEDCYALRNPVLVWSIMDRTDISLDAKHVWHAVDIISHRRPARDMPGEDSLSENSFVLPVWSAKLKISVERTVSALDELQKAAYVTLSASSLGTDVVLVVPTERFWDVPHLFPE